MGTIKHCPFCGQEVKTQQVDQGKNDTLFQGQPVETGEVFEDENES